MKKLLTVLMIGLMLVVMPTTSVFAEQATDQELEITDSTEGTIALTASKASSYCMQFPLSANVTTSGEKITLKAKGDVDSAYKIVVTEKTGATNTLVDDADSNNTVAINVAFGDAILGSTVTNNYSDTVKTDITVTHNGITNAGSYSYNLPIVISLVKITQ